MPARRLPAANLPAHLIAGPADWVDWLEFHRVTAPGVWLRLAENNAPISSVGYPAAIAVALSYG
jgi:hypothetical protein